MIIHSVDLLEACLHLWRNSTRTGHKKKSTTTTTTIFPFVAKFCHFKTAITGDMTLLCTCVGLTLGRCCCLYLPASIIAMYSIVTSLKRWVLLIYRYVGYVFVSLYEVEVMSRVCCLSEGFWEYIVVPSACFSVSYSEYYLFVHAVYGHYFTAFTNNAVFIHTMVKSGTQYPYVRTAYDGVCWPGVLCGLADLRILQRVKCG